jgi:two-component system sensor histidine kinase/response regulator
MSATVSHDMRTPLNTIITLIGSLKPIVNGERGLYLLKIIESSSKILLCLVNDILDSYQIKKGKFTKNETAFDIRTTI